MNQPQKSRLKLSQEDIDKVARLKAKHENKVDVEPEHLFMAEFGKHFGWQGYLALRNNEIALEEALWLIEAARIVDTRAEFAYTKAAFIGAGSANSKRPVVTFKNSTKDLLKRMEIKDRE